AAAGDAVDAPARADHVAVAGLEVAAADVPAHGIPLCIGIVLCIGMAGCIDIAPWPGWVRPGTWAGAAAAQTPSATSTTANTRAATSPPGSAFSANTAAATTAIQNTLMTPSANSASISPTQQPTQTAPCSAPVQTAPSAPRRPCISRWTGERQWRRHA